jgi:hypothetical protein
VTGEIPGEDEPETMSEEGEVKAESAPDEKAREDK